MTPRPLVGRANHTPSVLSLADPYSPLFVLVSILIVGYVPCVKNIKNKNKNKNKKKTRSAQITVDARDFQLVSSKSFWPGRLYCRKFKYNSEPQSNVAGNNSPANNLASKDNNPKSDANMLPASEQHDAPASETVVEKADDTSNLQLLLSPESNWGDNDHGNDTIFTVTPRGKSRGHESQSPPEQTAAEKRSTRVKSS